MKTAFNALVLLAGAGLILASLLSSAQAKAADNTGTLFASLGTHVETGVLQQLRPFFPKARTKLDKNGSLIILTCLRNAGPAMLKQIQPAIEHQFYSTDLLRKLVLSLSGTKRVDVGFEQDVLVFDLNTRRDAWLSAEQVEGYTTEYATLCR